MLRRSRWTRSSRSSIHQLSELDVCNTAVMSAADEHVQVQARWILDPSTIPTPVNALMVQLGAPANGKPDGVYLQFGHINPPVVEGPPGTSLTQDMVDGAIFPVMPAARLVVSLDRLVEMRDQLNEAIAALTEVDEP
jgi:hypothetical protein